MEKETLRLRKASERKRRIAWLKNRLKELGHDDPFWNYSQFKIEGLLFIVREKRSRYDLVAKKQCKKCKAWLHSYPVNSLLDLGIVLASDNGWAYHTCSPHDGPKKIKPQPTPEEKAYALIAELIELVGGEFLAFREKE